MLNFKSVRDRLTVLFVLLSAVSTLVVGIYFIGSQIRSNDEQVESYKTKLSQQYDRELRIQTEGLISAVEGLYKEQQAGRLAEAEAKKLAMDIIRNTRFDDGKGYFSVDHNKSFVFINDNARITAKKFSTSAGGNPVPNTKVTQDGAETVVSLSGQLDLRNNSGNDGHCYTLKDH